MYAEQGALAKKHAGEVDDSVGITPVHQTDESSPWRRPLRNPVLGLEDVHVWRSGLKPEPETLRRLSELLSSDEKARAERFHFDKDRNAYVTARGVLRTLLGSYLDAPPGTIEFSYGPRDKPALGGDSSQHPLRFNVSHSGEIALYAFTLKREVGVDIEGIRPDFAGEKIARRFFSPFEVTALLALPAEAQTSAFFDCWTRKEAVIKALGEGLSFPLDAFDVTLAPGQPAELIATRPDAREAERWSIREISVPPGYAAAVAVEARAFDLHCFLW